MVARYCLLCDDLMTCGIEHLEMIRWSSKKVCAWMVRRVPAPKLWHTTAMLPGEAIHVCHHDWATPYGLCILKRSGDLADSTQ